MIFCYNYKEHNEFFFSPNLIRKKIRIRLFLYLVATEKNKKKAFELYKEAAVKGDIESISKIENMVWILHE
jgi:hypothetical protein